MTLKMPGKLQPLEQSFAIVGSDGRPTQYFIRWAQQRQIDITASITAETATQLIIDYLATHPLIAGNGIALTPSGNLTDSPTITALVQQILDQLTTVHGSVLYRDTAAWAALAPGTAGQFLRTNGAAADPDWATPAGGGSSWPPLQSPLAATFTDFSNDATNVTKTDDINVGLSLNNGPSVNGNVHRITTKLLPSSGAVNFEHIALVKNTRSNLGGSSGVVLQEESTGKLLFFGVDIGVAVHAYRGTLGSLAAILFTYNIATRELWTKITYDSATSTYTLFTSTDGKNWIFEISSIATASFTTRATRIGYGFRNASATPTKNPLLSVLYESLI
jgi:hypothetical protein